MAERQSNSNAAAGEDTEIIDIFLILWRNKWLLTGTTFAIALITALFAFNLTSIYRSSALVTVAENPAQDIGRQVPGGLGGVASVLNLDLGGGAQKREEIILAKIQSYEFITDFIARHDIKPLLFAVGSWDPETGEIYYDDEAPYDPETGTWDQSIKPLPSDFEAFEEFSDNILVVQRDAAAGLVTIGIDFPVPELAYLWITAFISDFNDILRAEDIEKARRNIDYLEAQMETSNVAAITNVFSQLVKEQIQRSMLAQTKDEYALETIDPPIIPEEPHGPRRVLILALGIFFGGLVGLTAVYIRQAVRKRRGRVNP